MAGKGEGSGSDFVIKKIEETGVQMLKNKNKLLKKFGKPGLKAYRGITRKGVSFAELEEKSGLPPEQLSEIIEFMEKGGIAEVSGALPPKGAKEEKEERKPAAPEEEAPPEKPAPRLPPVSAPRQPPLGARPPAPGTLFPVSSTQQPAPGTGGRMAETEKVSASYREAIRKPETETRRPGARPPGMIKPISDEELEGGKEEKEREEEKPEEEAPEEKELPPRAPKPPESPAGRGISPIDFEEKAPAAPAPPPRAPPAPPAAPRGEREEEKPEEEFLTPSEKAIKEKYGETGLMVYSFIDGQRTAEQIMREAGVTEAQLIEMLDFMEKKGIIRLEHPERKRAPTPPPRAPPPRMAPPVAGPKPPLGAPPRPGMPPAAQAPKSMFAPMVEEQPTLVGPISEKELASISLDIPVKTTKGNILLDVQAKAQVMIKFGRDYSRAYEMIDGTKDVVDISLALKLPLYRIYDMLTVLQGMKAVMLKSAARDDIRKKYGEDGYSVYKKYGREGVLLYQLIGKEMSLKEMAALITTEPSKVIEMFMFIHKLLGIELPIDEDILRERLGIEKEEKKPVA